MSRTCLGRGSSVALIFLAGLAGLATSCRGPLLLISVSRSDESVSKDATIDVTLNNYPQGTPFKNIPRGDWLNYGYELDRARSSVDVLLTLTDPDKTPAGPPRTCSIKWRGQKIIWNLGKEDCPPSGSDGGSGGADAGGGHGGGMSGGGGASGIDGSAATGGADADTNPGSGGDVGGSGGGVAGSGGLAGAGAGDGFGTGGSPGSGGATASTGGMSGTGGRGGTGGASATGGAPATGGASSTGGRGGTGGATSSSGGAGTGGVIGQGGVVGTGGVIGGAGGVQGSGGAVGTGGAVTTGGVTGTGGASSGGMGGSRPDGDSCLQTDTCTCADYCATLATYCGTKAYFLDPGFADCQQTCISFKWTVAATTSMALDNSTTCRIQNLSDMYDTDKCKHGAPSGGNRCGGPRCKVYCDAFEHNCPGGTTKWTTNVDCQTYCMNNYGNTSNPDDDLLHQDGLRLGCFLYWAGQAGRLPTPPQDACANASPDSPVCKD